MSEVLRLEHVSKSFGSKDVLKDINFSVNSGEIIGYIGSNGAGKTTTIKIILGLIDDYQGDVFIFGEKVKGQFEYKKRIGYVPEVSDMYDNLTAHEYLSFIGMLYGIGEDKAVKKGKEMMSVFGIDDAINGRIHTFSKGMRQKLSIITGMIHNPDILFLDEPLGGIDANSVLVFKEVLKNLKKEGKTIFYSSHILEVVEKLSLLISHDIYFSSILVSKIISCFTYLDALITILSIISTIFTEFTTKQVCFFSSFLNSIKLFIVFVIFRQFCRIELTPFVKYFLSGIFSPCVKSSIS
jgi:ABC-2 type transport system ATP-binding protein